MKQGHNRLLRALKRIESDLRTLTPNDKESLVKIGIALEKAAGYVPEEMPRLTELIKLSLECLKAIYLENRQIVDVVAEAIAAAQRFLVSKDGLGSEPLIREAAEALQAALRPEPNPVAAAHQQAPPPEEASSLSLDDAAALLVQIEPTSLLELARVQQSLNRVAVLHDCPASARKFLVEASQKIDDIIQGTAPDPGGLFAQVGRLIEAAGNAIEEFKRAAPQENADRTAQQCSDDRLPMAPIVGADAEASVARGGEEDNRSGLLPTDADSGLIGDFIIESREYIEGAEAALLSLEVDPEDTEAINTVFRAFHTIKGTSGFLGLTFISDLAHHAESLLSRIRDQEIRCTGGYADLALRSIDTLKELIQIVQDALGGQAATLPEGYADLVRVLADPEAVGISGESKEVCPPPRLGDILVAEGKASREEVEMAVIDKGEQPIGIAVVRTETASLTDTARALRTQQRMANTEQSPESSVRVRTDRLDKLVDMVGELVIAQSMVAQDETVVSGGHLELARKISHAGKIVRELQDLSMSMRMVPLKATFQKMARLVRDLAHKSGKLVNLVTDGQDTEIDRNMVDIINDLLVHMVRNAVDHGIESPDEREKSGKSRSGTVRLSAYHSGGTVVVEIRDDGRGLDRDKIIKKAVSKGLIELGKGMSDHEVYSLIFEPGFSTADKITDISGRGVGMDVVKRGVESLRGRIDISSEVGQGCCFSVRLPLTLAITDGMLVKVGQERYIIPTVSIHLSFQPDAGALSTVAGRGEMVMLRGELMPIFRLHRLFNIQGAIEEPTKGLLVVISDADRRCALLVDELLGQQQVVAKTLGDGIGKVQGVSGGAILGDGRVGLILDPTEIVALARQATVAGDRAGPQHRSAA